MKTRTILLIVAGIVVLYLLAKANATAALATTSTYTDPGATGVPGTGQPPAANQAPQQPAWARLTDRAAPAIASMRAFAARW
jgi:hypothetical protein